MSNPRKAFSKIYDKWVDKIYRFIYLKVNCQEIAEDLCSEVFLRGWENFKENHNDIENPSAFLYQIARNLVIDHYREKGRTQFVSSDNVPVADPRTDLEEMAKDGSDLEIIKSAINNLKDEYKEVIILRYLDDLSNAEISEITDKSEGAVRVMISRALKALKNEVENGSKEA